MTRMCDPRGHMAGTASCPEVSAWPGTLSHQGAEGTWGCLSPARTLLLEMQAPGAGAVRGAGFVPESEALLKLCVLSPQGRVRVDLTSYPGLFCPGLTPAFLPPFSQQIVFQEIISGNRSLSLSLPLLFLSSSSSPASLSCISFLLSPLSSSLRGE